MNRLGFAIDEIKRLADHLGSGIIFLKVQTVFSHLAASEDPAQDEFTLQQFNLYKQAVRTIEEKLDLFFYTAYY